MKKDDGLTFRQRLGQNFTPGKRFMFAGLFFIIGFALTVGASGESRDTRLLEEEGVTTMADVLSANTVTRQLRVISVRERVRFTTAEGEVFEETITDCGSREIEPPGSTVEVRYAPSDPTAVQFADLECRAVSDATGFVIAGSICLVFSVLIVWSAFKARRRLRAGRSEAVPAGGPPT